MLTHTERYKTNENVSVEMVAMIISQFRWVLDPSFPLFNRLCFFRHPSAGHNTPCAQNPECTRVHFILQWGEAKEGEKAFPEPTLVGAGAALATHQAREYFTYFGSMLCVVLNCVLEVFGL